MNTLKSKLGKTVQLFLVATLLTTLSCSKDDSPSEPKVVTSTFTDVYDGIYTGNGTDASNNPFAGNVTIDVTGPTTATITGAAGNYTITGVSASAGGGYTGTANGQSISLSFSGTSNKDVNIGGPFTFNGSKP